MLSRLAVALVVVFFAAAAAADDFQFTPSIAVRQEYNDNIFFTEEDREEDFITTVIPRLEIENRTERSQIYLDGQLRPFFYWDNTDLDDIDHNYSGRLRYRLTPRFDASANAGFVIDNRPDRDIATTGIVFDTERRDRYHAGGGLGYSLSEISAVQATYGFNRDDFKGDEDEDFLGHTVGLGYTHNISRIFRATTARLNAGYGLYDYDTSESQSVYASVGVQTSLNETFSFLVDVGARYVDSDFDTLKLVQIAPGVFALRQVEDSSSNLGAVGSVSLRYDGLKTNWSLTASQDLRSAGGTSGPAYLTRVGMDLNHRILERLSVGIAASYNRNKADADDFSSREIDEDAFYIRPRLSWQFWRNFTLTGAYSFRYSRDDVDDSDARQHLGYVQLAYGYPLADVFGDLAGIGSPTTTGGMPRPSPD